MIDVMLASRLRNASFDDCNQYSIIVIKCRGHRWFWWHSNSYHCCVRWGVTEGWLQVRRLPHWPTLFSFGRWAVAERKEECLLLKGADDKEEWSSSRRRRE